MASAKVFFFINHPDEYTSINSDLLVDEFDLLTGEERKRTQKHPWNQINELWRENEEKVHTFIHTTCVHKPTHTDTMKNKKKKSCKSVLMIIKD